MTRRVTAKNKYRHQQRSPFPVENNHPVVDDFIVGCSRSCFIQIGAESNKNRISVVYAVILSLFVPS